MKIFLIRVLKVFLTHKIYVNIFEKCFLSCVYGYVHVLPSFSYKFLLIFLRGHFIAVLLFSEQCGIKKMVIPQKICSKHVNIFDLIAKSASRYPRGESISQLIKSMPRAFEIDQSVTQFHTRAGILGTTLENLVPRPSARNRQADKLARLRNNLTLPAL